MGLVAVVVALVAAACGGESENSAAFCDAVERLPDAIAEGQRRLDNPEGMDDLEAGIQALGELSSELKDAAPNSIRDEVVTVMDTDSDTVRVSEQEALASAREKVNSYIRSECDLVITL